MTKTMRGHVFLKILGGYIGSAGSMTRHERLNSTNLFREPASGPPWVRHQKTTVSEALVFNVVALPFLAVPASRLKFSDVGESLQATLEPAARGITLIPRFTNA